jgi:hypothetical protein
MPRSVHRTWCPSNVPMAFNFGLSMGAAIATRERGGANVQEVEWRPGGQSDENGSTVDDDRRTGRHWLFHCIDVSEGDIGGLSDSTDR